MVGNVSAIRRRDIQRSTFDPTNFMRQILRTVDNARSDIGPRPAQIIEVTLDIPSGNRVESRLNSFYRLIGLPAARNEQDINTGTNAPPPTDRQLSQAGTLNFFTENVLGQPGVGNTLVGREQALSAPKTSEDFVKMITEPLPLDVSIDGDQERRSSIFPLVVDASTPVYPLGRRVAPLFFPGDFILSGDVRQTRLPRPFLETIIYMRTQVFSGGNQDVQEIKADLSTNIETFITGNIRNDEEINAQEAFVEGFTVLELEIISKFIQAINNCAVSYRETVNQANELRQQVTFTPESKTTPEEATGNVTVTVTEEGDAQFVAVGIDAELQALQNAAQRLDAFFQTLPTNRVKEADSDLRIELGTGTSKNFTPDVFVSEFNSLTTFERDQLNRDISDATNRRQRELNRYNRVRENIQYYTGETTGLSIFDVLCTFLALFTISVEELVGLLNRDAQQRLLSSRFYSFQNSPDNTDITRNVLFEGERADQVQASLGTGEDEMAVQQSLTALETKIRENFKLANAFFRNAEKAGENRTASPSMNQPPEDTSGAS